MCSACVSAGCASLPRWGGVSKPRIRSFSVGRLFMETVLFFLILSRNCLLWLVRIVLRSRYTIEKNTEFCRHAISRCMLVAPPEAKCKPVWASVTVEVLYIRSRQTASKVPFDWLASKKMQTTINVERWTLNTFFYIKLKRERKDAHFYNIWETGRSHWWWSAALNADDSTDPSTVCAHGDNTKHQTVSKLHSALSHSLTWVHWSCLRMDVTKTLSIFF